MCHPDLEILLLPFTLLQIGSTNSYPYVQKSLEQIVTPVGDSRIPAQFFDDLQEQSSNGPKLIEIESKQFNFCNALCVSLNWGHLQLLEISVPTDCSNARDSLPRNHPHFPHYLYPCRSIIKYGFAERAFVYPNISLSTIVSLFMPILIPEYCIVSPILWNSLSPTLFSFQNPIDWIVELHAHLHDIS